MAHGYSASTHRLVFTDREGLPFRWKCSLDMEGGYPASMNFSRSLPI